jgi:hypothetical protein
MQDVCTHERENGHDTVQNQFGHDRCKRRYKQQRSIPHLGALGGPDTIDKDTGANKRPVNRKAGRALLEVSVCIE